MEGEEGVDGTLVPQSEVRFDLTVARDPKQVLAEAQTAAKALESVISQRKNAVKFNGKQYLTFEDWQTCGKFYGVTAKVVSTEYIEIGGTVGFIARAEAMHAKTGQVVSAAESMCMNDEPNWSKKPLFQLRSMAQTRACAKSMRNCLAWVVVLAGFEPSVAEEMTGDELGEKPKPIDPPKPKASAEPKQGCISEPQRKRFYAIWKGAGKTEEQVKEYLREHFGSEQSSDITKDGYEAACLWAGNA